ncbi:hypothetical protein R1sor_017216 [Riccia sorocarpa]|uniref:Uncharacterized protein n=1 Tax=Riccia sorocarpa TaxID=122646 RepID=A0ABD3I9J5_9MARC
MTRVKKFLKPYVLKMFFSNKYVSAQVVHAPTSTTVSAASTQEKLIRKEYPNTADIAAAAKIGQILAERLRLKDIPAVAFELGRGERYHGKRKALVDSLRESGPSGNSGYDHVDVYRRVLVEQGNEHAPHFISWFMFCGDLMAIMFHLDMLIQIGFWMCSNSCSEAIVQCICQVNGDF